MPRSRAFRIALGLLACAAAAGIGLWGSSLIFSVATQQDIRTALLHNCERDLTFKRQYKARAQVEKGLLRSDISASETTAAGWATLASVSKALANGPDPATDALLLRLTQAGRASAKARRAQAADAKRLLDHIHIIPLEGYCAGISKLD